MNSTLNPSSESSHELSRPRMSEILRGILSDNPGVETFSVERILASIGTENLEASLLTFALPAIVPVEVPDGVVALPTGALGYQLALGRKRVRLPTFVLTKSVSRRSLAVAIHAMLPILEAAERVVRPRWSWVSHPLARRLIGLLVFLLAVAIAYPLFGGSAFQAMSIFVLSLGMAEQDGLAVLLGVVAGVVSLALLAASGLSLRAMGAKLRDKLRTLARKLGLTTLARYLEQRGYPRIASILTFSWSDLLMKWDPERKRTARVRAPRPVVAVVTPHIPMANAARTVRSPSRDISSARRAVQAARQRKRAA